MSKSIATFAPSNTLPAHLQSGSGLGNENVTSDSLSIPKLDVIQQMSPQKVSTDAKFIEGAKDGDLFNSMTGELYDKVYLINMHFERQFTIFRDRKLGGGFVGTFDTPEAAQQHLIDEAIDPKTHEIVETHLHRCLMLDKNGQLKQPVLLYMSKSKLSVSSKWNTAISLQNQGADRFATVWTLGSTPVRNKQGQTYYNYTVDFAGFAGEELYNEASKIYHKIAGTPVPTH
jgi:hypothetical protein